MLTALSRPDRNPPILHLWRRERIGAARADDGRMWCHRLNTSLFTLVNAMICGGGKPA